MGIDSPTHSSIDKDLDAKQEIEHIDYRDEKGRRPILPQTPVEKQLALQEALKIDPGVSRFSWAAIQVSLVSFSIPSLLAVLHCVTWLSCWPS